MHSDGSSGQIQDQIKPEAKHENNKNNKIFFGQVTSCKWRFIVKSMHFYKPVAILCSQ